MSKSLEALESLISIHINIQNGTNMIFNTTEILNKLNTIKQDLKHKKQLQKEIAELKDQVTYLKEEVEGWLNLYYSSQNKNLLLKLEKQELEKNIEKFIEYLDKEPNRTIPKHSIKQILLKEVRQNEN